jgi:hypothetical protein
LGRAYGKVRRKESLEMDGFEITKILESGTLQGWQGETDKEG